MYSRRHALSAAARAWTTVPAERVEVHACAYCDSCERRRGGRVVSVAGNSLGERE